MDIFWNLPTCPDIRRRNLAHLGLAIGAELFEIRWPCELRNAVDQFQLRISIFFANRCFFVGRNSLAEFAYAAPKVMFPLFSTGINVISAPEAQPNRMRMLMARFCRRRYCDVLHLATVNKLVFLFILLFFVPLVLSSLLSYLEIPSSSPS
jgi:hypothetical protein